MNSWRGNSALLIGSPIERREQLAGETGHFLTRHVSRRVGFCAFSSERCERRVVTIGILDKRTFNKLNATPMLVDCKV